MSQILAFDVYGTLLDTSAISTALVEHLRTTSEEASEVAARWRMFQLEWVMCVLQGIRDMLTLHAGTPGE